MDKYLSPPFFSLLNVLITGKIFATVVIRECRRLRNNSIKISCYNQLVFCLRTKHYYRIGIYNSFQINPQGVIRKILGKKPPVAAMPTIRT